MAIRFNENTFSVEARINRKEKQVNKIESIREIDSIRTCCTGFGRHISGDIIGMPVYIKVKDQLAFNDKKNRKIKDKVSILKIGFYIEYFYNRGVPMVNSEMFKEFANKEK